MNQQPTENAADHAELATGPVLLAKQLHQVASEKSRGRIRKLVAVLSWSYWLAIVLLALLIHFQGDRSWFATICLFGPRWICLLPLALLTPLALLWNRRSLLTQFLATATALYGVLGFCVPVSSWSYRGQPTLRVMTLNAKGQAHGNPRLNELLQREAPDVLVMQGTWNGLELKLPPKWQGVQHEELFVASHYPLRDFSVGSHPHAHTGAPRDNLLVCTVITPQGEISLANVHLQSPHFGIDQIISRRKGLDTTKTEALETEIASRWQESESVSQIVMRDVQADFVIGDFNLPPESPIYRAHWSEYADAFQEAGWGPGGTEWPRLPAPLVFGIRIDHILTRGTWHAKACWVGADIGSDHLPVIADLYRTDPTPSPTATASQP